MLARLIVFLFAIGSLAAQDLDAFLKAAREHHAALADSIRDLTITRKATIFAEDGIQEVTFRKLTKGNKLREETITDNPDSASSGEPITVIELFDGESEWQFTALQGAMRLGGGNRVAESPSREYWIEPPAGSRIVGSEIMHNRDCWRVETDPTASYPYHCVWLDKEYYLMIRAESWNEDREPTVIENSELRFVFGDKFAIPSRTVIKKRWRPSMEMLLTELKLNQGLPDSLFDAGKIQNQQ